MAIKVLPATVAANPELRERFDREARDPMQVSINGGNTPFWHPSGDTLFWMYQGEVYEVGIEWEDRPVLGIPRKALESTPNDMMLEGLWDVNRASVAISPDGQYFVVGKRFDEGESSRLQVVLNWYNELAGSQ